jgi:hypothetical protein
VQVSQGYSRGEFDFTFFADGSVAIRSPSGEVVEGTVALGDQAAVREGTAINIDITSATYVSSGNSFMKAGATQLSGLFTMASSDKNDNVQYMWLGLSGKLMTEIAGPATYDEAMSTNEYILVSCGDDSACDFSPSNVPK